MCFYYSIKTKCNNVEAAVADSAFPEEHHKPAKGGSRILTHNLQYTILAENDGEALGAENAGESLNPENEISFSSTGSQRMANYALAGELSLKKDGAKSKHV